MSQGRGSALIVMMSVVIVSMVVVFHGGVAEAATFTVGDSGGWTFNTVNWPNGKRFKAGDILVFNYSPSAHNVVRVSSGGFNGCTTPSGSKAFQSGKDQIKLVKGSNFFICSFAGHCESGMKIRVDAV